MKRPTFLLAAVLLSALPLFAEDKTPAAAPESVEKDQDRLELMPSKPAQLLPPPVGLPLIPEIPVPTTKPRVPRVESPIKKRDSATADAEDAVRQRIRMREARTKAQRDPAIQAEWERAETMKTDYEKREVLKGYYKLLYLRMARIDSSLKAPIDRELQDALARLTQQRIATTQAPDSEAGGRRVKR